MATALDAGILALAVVAVGLITGSFGGAVKGYDGWGHLTKIVLVLRDFPSVDWNYDWYSGSPFFMGGYPPLFYFMAAAIATLGITAAGAMNALMVATYLTMALSLYGLVRIATGRRMAGFAASLLLLASPALWTHLDQAGLYPRVFGMGFVSLSVMLAVLYLRRPSLLRMLALVGAVAGALSSHVILGAIALGAVFLVLLLVPDGAGRTRPWRAALLVLPLLVTSYFYLPLAFFSQPQSPVVGSYPTVSISDLFFPGADFSYSMSAVLLPATLLAVVWWLKARDREHRFSNRLIIALILISGALLVYALFPLPVRVFAVRPVEVLFFLSWFLAACAGLAVGEIRFGPLRRWETGTATAVAAIAILSIASAIPTVVAWTVNNSAHPELVTAGWEPVAPAERSFRVASPTDNLSVWLNGVYDVPQTRGYAAQLQSLYPAQQYWLDNTVWSPTASDEQRNFLLDWYAVGWLYVPATYARSTAAVVPNLLARPDLYQSLVTPAGKPSTTFSYLQRTPIASTTNATTALVVGGPDNYNLVFRDLSYGDFGSNYVVPLKGSEYLDDYSAADLAGFDEIVLYGFRFHDQARALKLLADYVRAGGGLIVEASGSASAQASGLQDPLPVSSTSAFEVDGDWAFTSISSPVTNGVNFAGFGEARYHGGPWTASAATGVKAWAQPVLWSGGRPVAVAGQYGQGHVLWTGLNLPYHIDSFHNRDESNFLGSAVAWAARSHDSEPASFSANVDGPEQTTISAVTPARGVLFKESFYPNWHAYAAGRELTIYQAGPGFIYVRLPTGLKFPTAIVLRYEKSPVDWVGIALSIATTIALLTVFVWRPFLVPPARSALSRLRLRAWMDADE